MAASNFIIKHLSIFLLLIFSFALTTYPQPPVQWQKCFGGTNDDNASSIRPTKDGGYIAIGTTMSTNGDVPANYGFTDYWVVKMDKDGTLQWQHTLGGSKSDVAYSVEQTSDNGYIIAGYSDSRDGLVSYSQGATDFWLTKLDVNGNLQWQKTLGGSGHDNAHSVIQTRDGGFVVAGDTYSNDGDVSGNHGNFDGWVVKMDAAGVLLWTKCYGGTGIDDIQSIQQTSDGGYIMTGYTTSTDGDVNGHHGAEDLWVVKIDSRGNLQWQKALGGTGTDAGESIRQTEDGGYIIAGSTKSNNGDVSGHHGDVDAWIVKLDTNGNLQWQKCYGGSGQDMATSIIQTADKGFIIGAQTASANGDVTGNHGDLDYWIIRTDNTGNIQWQKCYGGSGSDKLASLQPTSDGWFVAAGSTTSRDGDVSGNHSSSHDFWVVKFGGDPRCLPTINIKVSQDKICFGTMVTFTATVTDGGTNGVYKWKKNGVVTGPNSASFVTSESMRDGDVVVCEYSCKTACGRDTTITSNTITMTVYNDVEPEVTIAASDTEVCEGSSITFTATPSFGRMTPSYQWLVNGSSAGGNSTSFSYSSIPNGATVQCVMTVSHPACQGSTKDHSNIIPITMHKIVSPEVKITASATSVCKGNPVTFSATGNGGSNATFQWMINGASTNTNTASFTTSSLSDGDDITCMMTTDPATKCLTGTTATSNHITITVQDATPPTISIKASDLDICEGSNVTFTANVVNAGAAPTYQWQLNGANTGSNAPTYSNNTLKHGDQVSCILTTMAAGCSNAYTVPSNKETISVKPLPGISFTPAEHSVMNGEQLQLSPAVSGNIASFEWTSTGGSLQNPQSLTPTTAPLNAPAAFQLKVVDDNGCIATGKVVVNVFNNLYMPNSFTPNGDGNNDVFRIPVGVSLQLEEFSVFDRWGNRIFTTKDATRGWDGTLKGRPLPTGTFVYLLRGKNGEGDIQLKGVVLLLR